MTAAPVISINQYRPHRDPEEAMLQTATALTVRRLGIERLDAMTTGSTTPLQALLTLLGHLRDDWDRDRVEAELAAWQSAGLPFTRTTLEAVRLAATPDAEPRDLAPRREQLAREHARRNP